MADRWIVSSHYFTQHNSLAAAEYEADRLREKLDRPFRIYRIKTTLTQTGNYRKMRKLLGEMREVLHTENSHPDLVREIDSVLGRDTCATTTTGTASLPESSTAS